MHVGDAVGKTERITITFYSENRASVRISGLFEDNIRYIAEGDNAHTVGRTINQHSTFPLITRLTGHSAWYYDHPGGSGVANANPEDIEGPDIFGLLRELEQNGSGVDYSLAGLSNSIEAALREAPENNPRRAVFFDRRDTLRSQLYRIETAPREQSEISAFFDVAVFAATFDLEWYVVG